MIVGVTAFVVVVSLIEGFNRYVDEKIAGIGAKSFTVNASIRSKTSKTLTPSPPRSAQQRADDGRLRVLKERATLIDKIGARRAALRRSETRRRSARRRFVSGATANCVDIENRDVAEGRFIAEPENEGAARVATSAPTSRQTVSRGNRSRTGDHDSRFAVSSDRRRSGEGNRLRYSAGHLHHHSVEDLLVNYGG
jgi:hypothetical protein